MRPNLLIGSGVPVTNKTYNIAKYKVTEDIELSTYYTLKIWGEVSEGIEFSAYIGGGNDFFAGFTKQPDGTWIGTGIRHIWSDIIQSKNVLWIFTPNNGLSEKTNSIFKIKLEKGQHDNVIWTPSIEDYRSIYSRLSALEAK